MLAEAADFFGGAESVAADATVGMDDAVAGIYFGGLIRPEDRSDCARVDTIDTCEQEVRRDVPMGDHTETLKELLPNTPTRT